MSSVSTVPCTSCRGAQRVAVWPDRPGALLCADWDQLLDREVIRVRGLLPLADGTSPFRTRTSPASPMRGPVRFPCFSLVVVWFATDLAPLWQARSLTAASEGCGMIRRSLVARRWE